MIVGYISSFVVAYILISLEEKGIISECSLNKAFGMYSGSGMVGQKGVEEGVVNGHTSIESL